MNVVYDLSEASPDVPQGFRKRNQIGPVDAVASDPLHAAQMLCELAVTPRKSGAHVHLINAYTVAIADKRHDFAELLRRGSINLPDGKPLTWVSRIRRDDVPLSQVRGPQFLLDVINHGRKVGVKHYLLGSTEEVLEKLESNLLEQYPGAEIVGCHSPPFREVTREELEARDAAIRATGAHVVWVGLGTPKQDYEAKRLADALPVVAVAIGAAFDFAAGTLKEAPHVYRLLGMEWAYRLAKEPRRLWRRYLFGNSRFTLAVSRRRSRHT